MGEEDSFNLKKDPFQDSESEEVLKVSFPYSSEPTIAPDTASVKIDYTAISLPPPKKTIAVRRNPQRTRVVNLSETKIEDQPTKSDARAEEVAASLRQLVKNVGTITLTTRETLQQNATISASLEKQTAILPRIEALQRHLDQSHKVETANQRLFDAMHEELKGYKDNFLFDSLQKPVIRDLVTLFDDLEGQTARVSKFLETTKVPAGDSPWKKELEASRDNLNNTVFFIIEVLNRLDVTLFRCEDTVLDLKLHKVVGFEPTDVPEEKNQIARIVRSGFLWKERVLRPTDVIVKKPTAANPPPTT